MRGGEDEELTRGERGVRIGKEEEERRKKGGCELQEKMRKDHMIRQQQGSLCLLLQGGSIIHVLTIQHSLCEEFFAATTVKE